jgi:cell division protein ZapE
MARSFDAMRAGPDEDPRLAIDGREIAARLRAGSVIWFEFGALCDGPRSQRDYLEIARRFAVVFVSGIPRMGADTADQARRFTWLIDILYDHRVSSSPPRPVPADARVYRRPQRARVSAHGEPADGDAHARLHGAAASPTATTRPPTLT